MNSEQAEETYAANVGERQAKVLIVGDGAREAAMSTQTLPDDGHEYYSACVCPRCTRIRNQPPEVVEDRVYVTQPYKLDQQNTRARLRQERQIGGLDESAPLKGRPGNYQARAVKDTGYVAHEGEPFLRRERPKVRGKAARRADRKARQLARQQAVTATPNTEIGS